MKTEMSVGQTHPDVEIEDFPHDAYIYVLKCRRKADGETYYYVGQTTDLKTRLRKHVDYNGDFAGPVPAGDEADVMAPSDEAKYEIITVEELDCIVRRHEYSSAPEWDFTARLRELERQKAYEVARKYDTTNVLGGAGR